MTFICNVKFITTLMTQPYSTPINSLRGNIILADRDVNLCNSLKRFLEREGYGVSICRSLSDFMTIEHDDVKCIVMDINLEGTSAVPTIEMIRQSTHEGDAPILLTCDVKSVDDVIKGLGAGADDYLMKPFSTNELIGRIRSIEKAFDHK